MSERGKAAEGEAAAPPAAAAPEGETPPASSAPPTPKTEDAAKAEGNDNKQDVLEGTDAKGTQAVSIKSLKSRKRRNNGRPRRNRKSDLPDCKTIEKCSVKSNSEAPQNEWLNEIVKDGSSSGSSKQCMFGKIGCFLNEYKYPIIGGILITCFVVYASIKKGAKKCPFTGNIKH